MKITCLKENLSRGLSTVSKAIPIRHSLPILTNVLITTENGRLKLSGTNLDTAITVYVGASIEEDGSITVPAKLLSEFISHLSSDTLDINLKNNILHITAGSTKSKFNGMSSDSFPDLPEVVKGLSYIEIDPKVFSSAVGQVGFSVSVDETRPVFSGILLRSNGGKLTIVGSDGFRLSEKTIDVKGKGSDFSIILPARTLLEVSRILNSCDEKIKMYLNESENLCLFECEDVLVASRIIDGTYPDYKKIIPVDTVIETSFSSSELLEAAKLTNVFAKDADNALKMTIDPKGFIRISASSQETGENHTEIQATIKGSMKNPFEIVFNARYFLDLLSNNKFDTLIFYATDKISPCLIRPLEEDNFLHVMAPMQIND